MPLMGGDVGTVAASWPIWATNEPGTLTYTLLSGWCGKQVEVLAFSSGLNDQLPHSVDRYSSLDVPFFKSN